MTLEKHCWQFLEDKLGLVQCKFGYVTANQFSRFLCQIMNVSEFIQIHFDLDKILNSTLPFDVVHRSFHVKLCQLRAIL